MITIHIDGLCEPQNPGGYGTWAYVATDETGREIAMNYGYIGHGEGITNNRAEYTALLEALRRAKTEGWSNCTIKSDSQLVVNQVNGNWRCKSETLMPLLQRCAPLATELNITLIWIPRESNTRADHLSNVAYNKARAGALQPV